MASGSESLSSTLRGGHDYVYDYLCSLCSLKDKDKEAVGYCTDCEDYLCAECFRYHRTPRPCRDHKLLDQTKMPKRPSCDVCCLDKKVRDAAGYCITCNDYLCSECYKYHLGPKPMQHHELIDQANMPLKKPSRHDNQARLRIPAAAAPSLKTHSIPQHVTPSLPARDARATRVHAQQQQQPGEARRSRAVHDEDISIAGQHEEEPWITGCVTVPGNRLVLVDRNNFTIIMLAAAGSTAQTQLTLTSKPFDITLVRSSQLAVTCPGAETITFVKLGDRLHLDREVKVKGKVLQTVVTEDQGKRLFTFPNYVAVSLDHASIYISDWSRNTVTRLSLAGQVLATFKDDKLVNMPRGLAVDKGGSVYVCGCLSHNVVQLAPDLTQPRELLQRSDGVRYPRSVCYCQATDKLYVGMEWSDVVNSFQLK